MSDTVQTWHYGLMARYWAEHNTTGPEIAYFQQQIEKYGQPALDAGCGTGRLLIPFLQAGLDVNGCDVSGDMLAYCQQTAEREGLSPRLYRQALYELDLPRRYQTIVACGVFGIGVSCAQDFVALQRFHQHLLPGGTLMLEVYVPYEDGKVWPLWRKEARATCPSHGRRRLASRRRMAANTNSITGCGRGPARAANHRRDAHAIVQGQPAHGGRHVHAYFKLLLSQ